jgi:hypothetical protein
VYVPSSALGPLHPLSRHRVIPPPRNQTGGHTLACGRGGGGSQFGRLEKKPGTLSTLCISSNKDDILTRLYTDRLSNRLLMALSRESENSEDGSLRLQVNQAADRLKAVIAPFVESSKTMAINMADQVQKNI